MRNCHSQNSHPNQKPTSVTKKRKEKTFLFVGYVSSSCSNGIPDQTAVSFTSKMTCRHSYQPSAPKAHVRVPPSFQPILLPLLLFVLTRRKGHDCHLEISKGPEHSRALSLTRNRGHDLPLTQPERTLNTFC